jgi:protein-export chaperone SecB
MSETTPAPQSAAAPAATPLVVNIQFVKDLSFEVPGAPQIFSTLRTQPNVQINLDVQARRIEDGVNVFEVVLVVRAEATEGPSADGQAAEPGRVVFIAELSYAGVFTLNGVPAADRMPTAAVPVCAQHPGRRDSRRRLPARVAAADRFRGPLAVPASGQRGAHRRLISVRSWTPRSPRGVHSLR